MECWKDKTVFFLNQVILVRVLTVFPSALLFNWFTSGSTWREGVKYKMGIKTGQEGPTKGLSEETVCSQRPCPLKRKAVDTFCLGYQVSRRIYQQKGEDRCYSKCGLDRTITIVDKAEERNETWKDISDVFFIFSQYFHAEKALSYWSLLKQLSTWNTEHQLPVSYLLSTMPLTKVPLGCLESIL